MAEELKIKLNTTSVAGTDDYNLLFNHPKINGVEVAGEKSLDDYGIKKKSEANAEHTEIEATISAETIRATAAEKVNADAIAQETESRRAGEKNLTSAIDTETTRATDAENVLANAIAKEVTDRTAAISNVEEALANEEEARTSADNDFSSHTVNTENPHKVTKAQVGLGNVDNTADADKNVKHAADSTTVNGHTVNSDVPEGAKFTDTIYKAFTGATSSADGSTGLVPKPAIADAAKYLCGDGTWKAVSGGTGTSDNPVKVDVILTSAVTSGTVTVYRIGHLLHIYGENLSVNFPSSKPYVTIFSLQNSKIGFKIQNIAAPWIRIGEYGTTDVGLVSGSLSEVVEKTTEFALVRGIGMADGSATTKDGIGFSLIVPLLNTV